MGQRRKGGCAHAKEGGPRCSAFARSSGKICTHVPEPGRTSCACHGGTGGRPVSSGRYTALPTRLGAAYRASIDDHTLLDQRQPIALLDALVKEQAARIADGDTDEFRERAAGLCKEIRALRISNAELAEERFEDLATLLDAGAAEVYAADKLYSWTERLAQRIDSAWHVRLARQSVMNAQDVCAVLMLFLQEVSRHVPPEKVAEIAARCEALVHESGAAPMDRAPQLVEAEAG